VQDIARAMIDALQEVIYLIQSAEKIEHVRLLCETRSLEPMRGRHLYTPLNFLEFASEEEFRLFDETPLKISIKLVDSQRDRLQHCL